MKRLIFFVLAVLLGACAPQIAGTAVPVAQVGERAAAAGKHLAAVPSGDEALPASPPDSCLVTRRPEKLFVPPPPYSQYPYAGEFWYGTPALWTALPGNGTWSALPHDENGYSQKLFWWRDGYDWQAEPKPALTVTTTRLDAPVATQPQTNATNGWNQDTQSFMLIGGDFPTAGCWQVTGRYHTAELTYVIWIAP
jgi:hypothetical protein